MSAKKKNILHTVKKHFFHKNVSCLFLVNIAKFFNIITFLRELSDVWASFSDEDDEIERRPGTINFYMCAQVLSAVCDLLLRKSNGRSRSTENFEKTHNRLLRHWNNNDMILHYEDRFTRENCVAIWTVKTYRVCIMSLNDLKIWCRRVDSAIKQSFYAR